MELMGSSSSLLVNERVIMNADLYLSWLFIAISVKSVGPTIFL